MGRRWNRDTMTSPVEPIDRTLPISTVSAGTPTKESDKDFKSKTKQLDCSELAELFFNETTAHGLGHFWNNRRNPFGCFWIVVVIVFSIVLCSMAYMMIAQFVGRPLKTESSLYLPLYSQTSLIAMTGGIQLPSIAICNRDFFSLEKIKKYNVSPELASYLILLMGDTMVTPSSVFRSEQGLALLEQLQEELTNTLEVNNMTLVQLVSAISLGCEDVMVACRLGIRDFANSTVCCPYFRSVPTLMGKCFYAAIDDSILQVSGGEQMGLTIILKKSPSDMPELDETLLGLPIMAKAGRLQLTVLSNITHPTLPVTGHGTLLEPKTITSIKVHLTMVDQTKRKTSIDWNEPECISAATLDLGAEKEDTYYQTSTNCLLANVRNYYRKMCNCPVYGLDMLREKPEHICSAVELHECQVHLYRILGLVSESHGAKQESESQDAKRTSKSLGGKVNLTSWRSDPNFCRPVCSSMSFDQTADVHPISPKLVAKIRTKFGIAPEMDFVQVTVFYPLMQYKYVSIYRESILDLVGNLGGQMGLMLGCSIITIMESITFLLLCCAACFKRNRRKESDQVS
ncbi:sodium channel protein Nach-like isoform X2 [Oratosquilla oratoria]|uniref:sodium channel protein Nach-like isoform X2 n=1 Tax=Oratosquilla oratoria TaxID=337810 RepID=UPI003F76A780